MARHRSSAPPPHPSASAGVSSIPPISAARTGKVAAEGKGGHAPAIETPRVDDADAEVLAVLRQARRQGKRRRLYFWLGVGAVAVAVAGFFWWRARQPKPSPYEFAAIEKGNLVVQVSATGTLEALQTVEIGAEVTGRVVSVGADFNDTVTRGQELAVIDPVELNATMKQRGAEVAASRAAQAEAEASAAEAAATLKRAEEQSSRGLISQKELEAARASALRAEAATKSAAAKATLADAALSLASSKLGKTRIFSPIDGIVLTRSVEVGQTVTAGFQTPILFKLAEDLSKMRLLVSVDEADVGRVREGMKATFTVDAYPNRVFPSHVVSLRNSPVTSSNVVSYQAVLSVDNAERLLRPGMTATAEIVAETVNDVLLVPSEAFRFVPKKGNGPDAKVELKPPPHGRKRVWVLRGPQPQELFVETGLSDGGSTVIRPGVLNPGDQVIIDQRVEGQ